MGRNTRKQISTNSVEARMTGALDRLGEFEEFESSIAPALRKAVKSNASPEEIFKIVKSYAAARLATIALTDTDSGKALSASKELLNWTEGKATERKDIKLEIEQLDDNQLDSKLASLLSSDDTSGAEDSSDDERH